MRNLLLANINEQHTLATRLFETLSTSLNGSRRGSTSKTIDPMDEVAEMYARLEALTEEQARLVELARRHQARWERLQRRRQRMLVLEERVRRVLVNLEQGRRELAGIAQDGRRVLEGIEMAEKGQSCVVPCFPSEYSRTEDPGYCSCRPDRYTDQPCHPTGTLHHTDGRF